MSDLNIHNSIAGLESFQSIQQVFRMIVLNKNLMATSDTFLGSEATFLSLLEELVTPRLDNNPEESKNYLELFITNQLYAMTIQIHSLADLVAQLIYENRLVTLRRNGVDLTIDKVTFQKVKDELQANGSGIYPDLLSSLTCFETEEFKYFASLSNTLKHKYIPVTNQGGDAISGELFRAGFQVDAFVVHESGTERLVQAAYLPEIIAKYDLFKSQIDQVFVELNSIANT
ncbi:hypothetical protein NDN13_05140 [Acinetobacter sp. C32I]|uniref:hypothetical protein n=1 Tax=Acinetobacter sp. C32I TaxID=2950074 RepID=UPI002036FE86|nr:hypothetical protein [Acinetobacter sp. C32I]USA54582.1 hypothetical protein NDN13_05140 [Acinetobacter sp. C32I]